MRELFTQQTLVIAPGQAVSGIAQRPQILRIGSGRVWITVEGIGHDYFLHAGDTFTAIPGRLTVVEADEEARIESRSSSAIRTVQNLFGQILQSLRHSAVVSTSRQVRRPCSDVCC